jgi:hypothetical protein
MWATRTEQNRNQTHNKLSMDKAIEIRKSNLSIKDLTLKYDVTDSTIYAVKNYKTWSLEK